MAGRKKSGRQAPGRLPVRGVFSYPLVLTAAMGAALLLLLVFHFALPDIAAVILIDREGPTYPFTVQNLMWFAFMVGLAELMIRLRDGTAEAAQLRRHYLPEDERTVLQLPDLPELYRRTRNAAAPGGEAPGRFLPRLIQRIVLQFQTSKSIEQANALLNSSLELYLHEVDLRYSMIRYIVWLIPTLGFIGTVVGISLALSFAGSADVQDPALLTEVTRRLAVAFNTTLLALVMSALLVLLQHIAEAREERAINRVGSYCLDNLINRLYES